MKGNEFFFAFKFNFSAKLEVWANTPNTSALVWTLLLGCL